MHTIAVAISKYERQLIAASSSFGVAYFEAFRHERFAASRYERATEDLHRQESFNGLEYYHTAQTANMAHAMDGSLVSRRNNQIQIRSRSIPLPQRTVLRHQPVTHNICMEMMLLSSIIAAETSAIA